MYEVASRDEFQNEEGGREGLETCISRKMRCNARSSPCFSIVARGRGRERKDEGGSVMNGRIYFEDFKTRGDATREKSDVTENFTFLTFGYIYIYGYLILDLSVFLYFLGRIFIVEEKMRDTFLKYLSTTFLDF